MHTLLKKGSKLLGRVKLHGRGRARHRDIVVFASYKLETNVASLSKKRL